MAKLFPPVTLPLCLILTLSAGCNLEITNPQGGHVESTSGNFDCLQTVCDFALTSSFNETFTAVADDGWSFEGWKSGDDYQCGGSTDSCSIEADPLTDTVAALLPTPVYSYLEPIFVQDELPPNPYAGSYRLFDMGFTQSFVIADSGTLTWLVDTDALGMGLGVVPFLATVSQNGEFSLNMVVVSVAGSIDEAGNISLVFTGQLDTTVNGILITGDIQTSYAGSYSMDDGGFTDSFVVDAEGVLNWGIDTAQMGLPYGVIVFQTPIGAEGDFSLNINDVSTATGSIDIEGNVSVVFSGDYAGSSTGSKLN